MSKRIVIIGGMGPQASLELHRRIICRASEMGAKKGSDFPEIMHLSLPIDDFISDEVKTKAATNMICHALERLYLWRKRSVRAGLQYSASAGTGA